MRLETAKVWPLKIVWVVIDMCHSVWYSSKSCEGKKKKKTLQFIERKMQEHRNAPQTFNHADWKNEYWSKPCEDSSPSILFYFIYTPPPPSLETWASRDVLKLNCRRKSTMIEMSNCPSEGFFVSYATAILSGFISASLANRTFFNS